MPRVGCSQLPIFRAVKTACEKTARPMNKIIRKARSHTASKTSSRAISPSAGSVSSYGRLSPSVYSPSQNSRTTSQPAGPQSSSASDCEVLSPLCIYFPASSGSSEKLSASPDLLRIDSPSEYENPSHTISQSSSGWSPSEKLRATPDPLCISCPAEHETLSHTISQSSSSRCPSPKWSASRYEASGCSSTGTVMHRQFHFQSIYEQEAATILRITRAPQRISPVPRSEVCVPRLRLRAKEIFF